MWCCLLEVRGEHDRDHHQGERADRQVDVEHPAPAQVVDEEPAKQRSDHARDAEHGAERALVLAALTGRDDVADDRLGQHDQAAAADALQGAERDQLAHAPRLTAEGGADQEDHDRGEEEVLAPVLVAQLPPDLGGRGGGEDVGGDHPGQVGEAAEVVDDGRQRGGHDRLVERRQQQREHERGVDGEQALTMLLDRSGCVSAAAVTDDSPGVVTNSRYPPGRFRSARASRGRSAS